MCRSALLLSFATLAATAWLSANDAGSPEKTKRNDVETVIKQLGDEKFTSRAAAMKRLETLGPQILPILKEAYKRADDPEVRRRIEDMLPSMEHAAALSPSRINLVAKDKPAKEVIAELAKQTSYKLDVSPQGDERERKLVTLEIKDMPFWLALEKVCEACGTYFQEGWYGGEQMSLRLEYGDLHPGYVCYEGPFRVSARGFNYSRNVDFVNGNRKGPGPQPVQRNEHLSMSLSITVEPKLPMLSAGQPLISEAIDDKDQSIAPPQQPNTHYSYYHGYRSYTHQVQAQLAPSKGGSKIKILKGTIPITAISAQRERLTVDKILDVKNQTFKAGTTTLTIEAVTRTGDEVEIKLSVTEAGKNDATRNNTMAQRFTLLDDKGGKYYGYVSRWTGMNNGGNGTMRFNSNGQNVGDPTRLIFYEWTTVTHAVPFEFKDLPLP